MPTNDGLTYGLSARGAFIAGFFSTAPGVSLDKLLEVFNFPHFGAAASTAELVLWGTNGTVLDTGSLALVEDTADAFALDANATIALKVIVVDVVQPGNDDLENIVEGLVAEIGDQPAVRALLRRRSREAESP